MGDSSKSGLIFISCGQASPAEIKLGEEISCLVRELTSHRPYFAQNENSLDAFTRNILGSLDEAVGLIAIMHPRGVVRFPDEIERARASVWIEQEIAIAAFITQVLGRPLRIAPYIHASVKREGMREQLQLNAVQFREDADVVQHLRGLLPNWRDLPSSFKAVGPPDVGVALEHGHNSNFLLRFTNRTDEEVLVRQVKLESAGIELTDPWGPGDGETWKVAAHLTRSFGKNIIGQRDPAAGLLRMNPNLGVPFQAEIEVVFICSVRGHAHEIRKRLLVKIDGTNRGIIPLV